MKDEYAIEVRNWDSEIQELVYNSAPEKYKLLEKGMSKNDQVILADYNFGDTLLKLGKLHLPLIEGGTMPYASNSFCADLRACLENRKEALPFTMIVKGCAETSSDSGCRVLPLGKFIDGNFTSIRNFYNSNQYNFSRTWTTVVGTQYLNLLPKIKDWRRYKKLCECYNITRNIPQNVMEQFLLFKEIAQSSKINWRTKILFFSTKTLERMCNGKTFSSLRDFMHHFISDASSFEKDYLSFDFIWEEFINYLERQGFKEQSYIYNIAKHLLLVAIGEAFAFVPAQNDNVAPISELSKAFTKIYKLRYAPTFMIVDKLLPENGIKSVYYSLQYPIHLNPSPGKQHFSMASDLDDIRSIKNIHDSFFNYMNSKEGQFIQGSVISEIPEKYHFEYFHNVKDRLRIVQDCHQIIDLDERFKQIVNITGLPFCYSSRFFQGCVKVSCIK